ncbi:hypothetical protein Sp245p_26310 (plasmid) [Azospirillum baldaniorum]|uniref:hypothetical protein n=1 Tax=Azospirillum baldaniorum TaxID=1064539 RepID=UPI0005A2103D|nr:hypothetical protein [Azospirillum baldaniorum]AWJ92631.1 hypothetical protein Sp245p_22520 [Azospirillum baldaniorum]AWJ93337.1 hypothetical protein Sp245p_26310 [Azospirillum baldaniorum]TWA78039.1 hypothetical protein FBZ85_106199 [Azospirillum brasilense]
MTYAIRPEDERLVSEALRAQAVEFRCNAIRFGGTEWAARADRMEVIACEIEHGHTKASRDQG